MVVDFLVLIIIIVFVVGFLLDKLINKLLGIFKSKKLSETPGKNVDLWGRIVILVLFVSTHSFVIEKGADVLKWFYIFYLVLFFGFQAILEWKYLKNSKQYISTIIFLVLGVVLIYCIEYFLS